MSEIDLSDVKEFAKNRKRRKDGKSSANIIGLGVAGLLSVAVFGSAVWYALSDEAIPEHEIQEKRAEMAEVAEVPGAMEMIEEFVPLED